MKLTEEYQRFRSQDFVIALARTNDADAVGEFHMVPLCWWKCGGTVLVELFGLGGSNEGKGVAVRFEGRAHEIK